MILFIAELGFGSLIALMLIGLLLNGSKSTRS
jgi:hypothetical protein